MTDPKLVSHELDKGYEPSRVEPKWAAFWEEKGLFHAEDESDKPPFSIVLPPPNVTGSLHIGHALTATIEDALVRWKRMSGYNACWLPGIDHAGIATQMVVERELLKKEGKSRHELGREEFLKRVWAWKEAAGNRIAAQHRALGASLDWERERFTMDARSSRAVREAFVRLHEEGLLYRAERLINWCVSCRTALSDLEVDHHENVKGELYKFAYQLADGTGEIVVATTRPETMLGDTAVAVHPDDPRYKAMIGKKVLHPITGREFPIIADAELVDPKFGTGAVKVTPAHSFEDFEAGKRHGLPLINILNLDGTLNQNAGPFQGKDRIAVRPELKQRLAQLALERGTEPHMLAIGHCQRCDSVVEPLLSKQWFVKTRPLADAVVAAVERDEIRFVPPAWRAELFRWMRDIHDWCISRQLWWGHQIPAWYCEYGHVTVSRETPSDCDTCHSGRLTQDPDVLDTWFSSGLWPFSTFGWPEKTKALETFYPNAVMETGFDILFFWVARMAMLGLHFMGEVPFEVVYLHAMVRDEKGEKMSKTRGNVIDPLEITAKHGADALRFTLASMAGQGRDIKLSVDRIAGYRAFANKIWNAARFVLMNAGGFDPRERGRPESLYDRWILSRYQRVAEQTQKALEDLDFASATSGLYRFVWNELCDWAIELEKPALYGDKGEAERSGAQHALLTALEGTLRLLHPFMPFVTEEIWQRLPKPEDAPESIMIAEFPRPRGLLDEEAEREMSLIFRAIDGARSVRGEVNLPPNQKIPLTLVPRDEAVRALLWKHLRAFEHLANAAPVELATERPQRAAVHVEPEVEVHLPLSGLIDFDAEKTRVEKELAKLAGELTGIEKRLGNQGFVARAPKEVVEKDRARAEELQAKREKLARHLARVTSPEVGMQENKNPENNGSGSDGQAAGQDEGQKQQGMRSPDQFGTHGGPAGHGGQTEQERESERLHAEDAAAAEVAAEAAATDRENESAGSGPSLADDARGLLAKAKTRVKSIARDLMEKAEAATSRAAPRPKARKATAPGKSAGGGKKKAAKAGKAGKRGAKAVAARGAKKSTRGAAGKAKKQAKRPKKTQSRGKSQGSKKGARGKAARKRR